MSDLFDRKLIICAILSVVAHWVIARSLEELPQREPAKPRRIDVRVVEAPRPPAPEPPPPPEPPPAPREQPVHEAPRPRPPKPAVTKSAEPPPETPPVTTTTTSTAPTTTAPKFGVTMESTSQGGSTSAPVGNTTTPTPSGPTAPGPAAPLPAPVAAHEVTKMPLPRGSCAGKYTDAARGAGLEGVVVLDLIVDEKGRARDIQIVEGLDHGLTEAAITALRACQFTPGEKDGSAVPVRVRGFKIRFVLQ